MAKESMKAREIKRAKIDNRFSDYYNDWYNSAEDIIWE